MKIAISRHAAKLHGAAAASPLGEEGPSQGPGGHPPSPPGGLRTPRGPSPVSCPPLPITYSCVYPGVVQGAISMPVISPLGIIFHP